MRVGLAGLALAVGLSVVPAPSADARPNHVRWLVAFVLDLLYGGPPPTTTTTSSTTSTSTSTSSTSSTSTTVAPPAEPCGEPVYKDQLEQVPWSCTFADEFDGDELDRDTWSVQTSLASGFGSQDDCFLDRPENVAVADGTLRLSVVRHDQPFFCQLPPLQRSYSTRYSSASVSTFAKWSQAFGRFEIRAKFPAATAKGLHGALWLWPDDPLKYGPWPLSGEIDIAEVFSQYNDRAIPYVHYLSSTAPQTNNNCLLDVDSWHTYTLEWTPTHLTVTYDDTVCLHHRISSLLGPAPKPFDHPFMISLTEALGVAGNRLDEANLPSAFPATLEVDYVRAWE